MNFIVIIKIAFYTLVLLLIVIFLIWSSKNGQYRDDEKARNLPLEIDDKPEK